MDRNVVTSERLSIGPKPLLAQAPRCPYGSAFITSLARSRDRQPDRWTSVVSGLLAVRLRHAAVVERLVEHRLLDALLPRHLAQRAARGRRLLHDLRRTVVADVRVERGRGREGQLRVALAGLAVRLDPVHAFLGEDPA